jgi:nucleoside-diphosphate-sugar epimerase
VDFECVNALDTNRLEELIVQHKIDCIYHLAAILSAKGEKTLFNLGMLMLTLFK